MGRGIAWLDTGTHECAARGGALHRDHRAPAGAEDRLPRGDRLPHGLHRRARSSSARRAAGEERLRRSTCCACCADRVLLVKVIRTAIPDVLDPRARGVRRRARLLPRELEPARASTRRSGLDVRVRAGQPLALGRGVLRGLHYQIRQPQGKLVRVIAGEVFDVAVDLRRSSPTFGRWVGVARSIGGNRAHAVDPAGLRARLPRALRARRSSSTRPPTTTRRSTSARCSGTTRRSASPGRSRAQPLLEARTRPARRSPRPRPFA